MNQELKFRTVTSIVLLFFLFLIFISSNFLIILLFISSILALTEFFYLMDKIFNNKKYLQMLTNLVFISYIFLFSLFFQISYYLNTTAKNTLLCHSDPVDKISGGILIRRSSIKILHPSHSMVDFL